MSPKRDVSVERKQQIYEAALTCFSRKGYHLTTMDDIVAEVGLSKGTLYWYFDSKKSLFLSLFQETMGSFGDSWETIFAAAESDAASKLLTGISFFRTEFEGLVPLFGLLLEAWALTRHDEEVERATRELFQPYVDAMTGVIREGVEQGDFSVESAEATAMVVVTLFDGIMLALGTGMGTYHDWDRLMDAAEALVMNGLGGGSSREK